MKNTRNDTLKEKACYCMYDSVFHIVAQHIY